MTIEKAIPCGLIISELVSNSLKYAFPEGRDGIIRIELFSEDGDQESNSCILIVSDNGIGFPEDLNLDKTKTLGLQLVKNLTKQMDGVMNLEESSGTSFKITFSHER